MEEINQHRSWSTVSLKRDRARWVQTGWLLKTLVQVQLIELHELQLLIPLLCSLLLLQLVLLLTLLPVFYLSGCSSGLPNDGGVGFTQQRLGKVWLLLQHLPRLIHPTAAERRE